MISLEKEDWKFFIKWDLRTKIITIYFQITIREINDKNIIVYYIIIEYYNIRL